MHAGNTLRLGATFRTADPAGGRVLDLAAGAGAIRGYCSIWG